MSKCLQLKMVYANAFASYIANAFVVKKVSKVPVDNLISELSFKTGGSSETFKRYALNVDGSETPLKLYTVNKKKFIKVKDGRKLIMMFGRDINDFITNTNGACS